jgi:hypothetical protein
LPIINDRQRLFCIPLTAIHLMAGMKVLDKGDYSLTAASAAGEGTDFSERMWSWLRNSFSKRLTFG